MISQQVPGDRVPFSLSPLQRVTFPSPREGRAQEGAQGAAPLVSVVVTIHDGQSYDPLFREYRLEPAEGRASVWACGSKALGPLLDHLRGEGAAGTEPSGEPYAELCAELGEVDPDSVVFNWECCSECSDGGFANTALVLRAVELLLSRGHTLMFSDFSLKALLGVWRGAKAPASLGPCPLVKLGDFGTNFELRFSAPALQACGSAQLERVGDLCENGEATVRAMGGTIAYTVDGDVLSQAPYTAEVLTVVTAFEGAPALRKYENKLQGGRVCAIGSHRGAAGHVRLRYPNGGSLLLSCGHWVELVKLDVTAERLVQVAEQEYGVLRSREMAQELAASAPAARAALMQKYAKDIVMQSSPGTYTKQKK